MSDAGSQPEPLAAGSPSAPITVPPQEDFPVEWASADEQKIPWQLDLMHFNDVMPPLEGEYWAQFMDGLRLSMEHFEMPLQGKAKPFNYWLYFGIFPRFPPEQMEEQSKRSDEVVRPRSTACRSAGTTNGYPRSCNKSETGTPSMSKRPRLRIYRLISRICGRVPTVWRTFTSRS